MQYIFVHGLGQNSSSWDRAVSLMPKKFNAVRPDLMKLLEGEIISYGSLYHKFSNYCNDISEPLNLCGLSLGGIIALNYAIDFPGKVQSLVLIGVQYKMPGMLLKIQNLIFRLMPESAFKNMGFQKKDIICLTNSMIDMDLSEKLQNISLPTLVICGEKDGANKKAAKVLAMNIKGARLSFIENTGHEVNKDNPEKLAAELENFFETIR